jgi:RNA polymerase sigma factor (sigma-70 family)
MATGQMNDLIQRMRRAALLQVGIGQSDGQLLEDYISRRDEAALAVLVRRHGPMVWGVCRRVLADYHDAEDAFQATFLVFVRKAASVKPRAMLANWLYGVAHQTALNVRTRAAKRKGREKTMAKVPEQTATDERLWQDLHRVLDEELSRLPDTYRLVVVLCDLEGKTRKEVAQQLSCREGTVAGRLARARQMLARRLTQRGVVLSGSALAALLLQSAASADVPGAVVSATIGAANLFAAGKATAAAISPKVVAAAEGVLKAMMMSKLKAVITVLVVLGLVMTGLSVLIHGTTAEQRPAPPFAEEPVNTPRKPEKKNEKDKESFTAWGEEAGGLQAGLGYAPGQKRAYHHGETVRLVIRVRNVSKEAIKFQYLPQFLVEEPPAVTDGQGNLVRLPRRSVTARVHQPVQVNLAPGKEFEPYDPTFKLVPATKKGADDVSDNSDYTLFGTGKFQVQYKRVIGKSSAGPEPDPKLSKLATGKLELEVKSDPTNLEKWTQGKGVVDVCFAGPWLDPLNLRASLKTKVPETDRDFRLACGEGGGENRAFVQVSMTVTPDNVRRLLALQAELKPRGYLLDPKESTVWSYPIDSKLSQQVRTLVPQFREAVERDLKNRIPKAQCHLEKNRFLRFEVPGTKARGFVDVYEIRPGLTNTDVAVGPEEELHLPHLGLWIRVYYRPGEGPFGASDEDAATHDAHDAIRKVFRQAVEPFLKLDPDAAVRNGNHKWRDPSRK